MDQNHSWSDLGPVQFDATRWRAGKNAQVIRLDWEDAELRSLREALLVAGRCVRT